MSDLVKDINYLRYYHVLDDSLKDKDLLKNQTFIKYSENIKFLFLFPLAF